MDRFGGKGSKPKVEAVSLIDFDFDVAEIPSAKTTIDDTFAGLSLGGGAATSSQNPSSSMSLFDLDPIDFTSSSTPPISPIPKYAAPLSYFNNVNNQNGMSMSNQAPSTSINWGNSPSPSNSLDARSSTPVGAIQLSTGSSAATKNGTKAIVKDPFDDLLL